MPTENDYIETAQLIDESPHVSFGSTSEAPSDDWLERAEERLGVKLPPSYRWWLRRYGGGEIGGDEIFSVYGVPFDEAVGGDIVYMNSLPQRKSASRIFLCSRGEREFFFETASESRDGELQIVEVAHDGQQTPYARDFLDFLRKQIAEFG